MSKAEILNALIDYYDNGNKSQFSKRLGVKAQTINTWLARNTFDIDLIFAKCDNVNANWLLSGKGNMLVEKKEIRKAESGERGIPLVPLHAMAGMLVGEQQVMEYECERYVVPAFQDADFLITVKGNSMSPTYTSGDLVACKKLDLGSVFFQWNKTYVIDTDQGALIKRIQPGHDKQHITIVSDNSDYAPFELETEHIYAVALVVGMIRME